MSDTKPCPYCGKECETKRVFNDRNEIVDAHYCDKCEAIEIIPGDSTEGLTENEINKGWRLLGVVTMPPD